MCAELTYCDWDEGETELLAPSLANDRVCLPELPPSDGAVALAMRLNMSFAAVRIDIETFNQVVRAEIGRALGVSVERIIITRVVEGSVIVEFTLLEVAGASADAPDAATADAAMPQSPLPAAMRK